MKDRWYAKRAGLAAMLEQGLPGLVQILAARKKGCAEKARLLPVVLAGQLYLDAKGGCSAFTPELLPSTVTVPAVCTWHEFQALVREHNPLSPADSEQWFRPDYTTPGGYYFPAPPRHCALCGEGWTTVNVGDVSVEEDIVEMSLEEFVGKTLHEAEETLANRPEAIYIFIRDIILHTLMIRQTEEKMSADGFYLDPATPGFDDDSDNRLPAESSDLVEKGDTAKMYRYRFYHGKCYAQLHPQQSA